MTADSTEKCRKCALFLDGRYFCAQLSSEQLTELSNESRALTLERGEALSADGLKSWPIIAISAGVVSIQHLLKDGRKSIAAFLMPGDIIDLRSFSRRTRGQLVALGKSEVCRVSPQMLDMMVAANPGARTVLWENLRDQSFRAMDHAADLAKKRALEKLASFIFECRIHYSASAAPEVVSIPVRRVDLADYLGMQPETLSRCFHDLEDQGILDFKSLSAVAISDVPTLRRIANGDRAAGLAAEPEKPIKILRFA